MKNNEIYQILEQKFVKKFLESRTIFTGFTYLNEKDKRIVYPRLMQVPKKGGVWCFYAKRDNKEHISIDEFINRLLEEKVIGVGGYLPDGKTSSITFSNKHLLRFTEEFSDFLHEVKINKINNINSDSSSSQLTGNESSFPNFTESNKQKTFEKNDSTIYRISKLKVDMESELSDLDQQRMSGEDINAIVKRRVGQSLFRDLLMTNDGSSCHISQLNNRRLLIASHIVPWSESTGDEKTDPDNGLLLAVNWDAVFDKWLITFDSEGKVIISKSLNPETLIQLGIDCSFSLKDEVLNEKRLAYLKRHRNEFDAREKLAML